MNPFAVINRTLLGALVWTIAGTLFGGLFTLGVQTLSIGLGDILGLIGAAAIAGAITAAFFGSMRSATLGTMMGVLSGVGYLTLSSDAVNPLPFLIVSFVAASWLGHVMPHVRGDQRPLGHTVSGLVSGIGSGLIMNLMFLQHRPTDPLLTALIGVALVGLIYVLVSNAIVARCNERVSEIGAPMVSGLIACVVSLIIWLLINTTPAIDGSVNAPEYANAFALVAQGAIGGALGGCLGGALLGIFGLKVGEYAV